MEEGAHTSEPVSVDENLHSPLCLHLPHLFLICFFPSIFHAAFYLILRIKTSNTSRPFSEQRSLTDSYNLFCSLVFSHSCCFPQESRKNVTNSCLLCNSWDKLELVKKELRGHTEVQRSVKRLGSSTGLE